MSWNTANRATCWHAADRALAGAPFVDAKLAAELRPHVDRLAAAIQAAGCEATTFFAHLLPHAVSSASTRDILGTSLATECLQEIESALTGVEGAVAEALPRLEKELPLRAQPIQMQWEARGPGFIRGVERLLGAPSGAAGADSLKIDVALVYPICGGFGATYTTGRASRAAQRVVYWEALLTDIEPRLPELLRLGWLVTQQLLAAQLADSDAATAGDPSKAISLAAAAVALSAGEDVELARDDRATLELALKTWRPPQADGPRAAAIVSEWWSAARREAKPTATLLADLTRRLTPS